MVVFREVPEGLGNPFLKLKVLSQKELLGCTLKHLYLQTGPSLGGGFSSQSGTVSSHW